jgi:hypothetical protein
MIAQYLWGFFVGAVTILTAPNILGMFVIILIGGLVSTTLRASHYANE